MERIWLVVLLGIFGVLLYLVFAPFLASLAWAAVMAILFFPVHRQIRRRIRRPNLAAFATTMVLTLVLIVPALLLASAFTRQTVNAVQNIQQQWQEGKFQGVERAIERLPIERIRQFFTEPGENQQQQQLSTLISENAQRLVSFVARQTGRLARNLLVFLFDLLVTLLAVFYLFRDGAALMERLRGALPLPEAYREGLFYIAQNVLYATVFSSFVVAAVQGVLGGTVFWLLGISAPVFWGVIMGLAGLIPALGPWLIWLPAMMLFLLEGDYMRALILLIVGAGGISLVDNVLRPMLISGRAQLNGLLVFISVLGGIAAFGLLGLVLGPILVALGAAILETYATASQFSIPPAAPATPQTD